MREEAPAGPESLKDRLTYVGFAAVERLAMALPHAWGRNLFDLGGEVAFFLAPKTRRVVESNLARVLGREAGSPEVRAAARESFHSYARYWFEAFRVRVMSDQEFLHRFRVDGGEHLERFIRGGKGAIMALPHMGNYDAAGHWVALAGYKISAVAEQLRPERLFRLFLHHREALGLNVVPLGDDRKVGEDLVRLLGENHVLALVSDRYLRGRGIPVEMFGEKRKMPVGPALLALATESPLMACSIYDTADGWVIVMRPVDVERTGSLRADVVALTQRLAGEFERSIASAPTQWHMFQPAWDEADAAGGDEAVPSAAVTGP